MTWDQGGAGPARRGRWLVLAAALGVATLIGPAAHAGGEDLGPNARDLRAARAAARRFRAPGGLKRALDTACHGVRDPKIQAAEVVLVAHGAQAMPVLLDAYPAPHPDRPADDCWSTASRAAMEAVCEGRHEGAGYALERRSEAAVRLSRRAAARALVRALTSKVHHRRGGALRILLATSTCDDHQVARRLVRAATPSLVKLLADPTLRQEALEALAADGADARVARSPLRRWLKPDDTLPRAVTALARMGEPMASLVPRLRGLLAGPHPGPVVEALGAIGPDARAALPDLAALTRRPDPTCRRLLYPRILFAAIRRIASPPEARAAGVAVLAPWLRCPSLVDQVSNELLGLGHAGVAPVIAYLRRDDVRYHARLEVARALTSHQVPLGAADEELVRLLGARERRLSPAVSQVPPPGPGPTARVRAAQAWRACRAESGLKDALLPVLTEENARSLTVCLDAYLCGPSAKSYQATRDRCCARVFGDHPPAFCAVDR